MANEQRLIDANALDDAVEKSQHYNPHDLPHDRAMHNHEHRHFRVMIAQAPTVDAVEVVRCKDCLYYEETVGKDSGKPCGYGRCAVPCHWITGIVYDEDFCSYGERKEDGKE